MHEYLNFDSKGAPLSEPETLQEAQQRKANDLQNRIYVPVSACVRVLWRGVGNSGMMQIRKPIQVLLFVFIQCEEL